VDTVRNFDRSIHLSTSLISNFVNQKVAPASLLTLSGLGLWVTAVREALAAEVAAAQATAAGAAAAPGAEAAEAEDPAQSVRQSGRARVPSKRHRGAGAGSGGLGLLG
jgi:hypothetical protein